MTRLQAMFLAMTGTLLLIGPGPTALAREVPSAPAEYLSKQSPFKEGDAEALKKGAKLYESKCAKCHGTKGDGLGKSAKDLNPPVVAFSKPGYMKSRKDGQLFYIIEQGSPNTDMEAFGPGTAYNFSAEDMWAMVTYMRSKFTK